jgi:hypothetical protein
MATIRIYTKEFSLETADETVVHEEATLSAMALLMEIDGTKMPQLSIEVFVEGTAHSASVDVWGYEEIDALRRYCEMTLELFDRGRLT